MKTLKTLFICSIIFIGFSAYGQSPVQGPDIYVYGYIEDYFSKDRLDSCVIEVFHNDVKLNSYPYDGIGAYEFYLKFDTLYTIEFSCPGCLNKHLSIDGRHIPKQVRRFGFSMGPVIIGLFEPLDDIDYSAFKNPMGRALFNDASETFDYDSLYNVLNRERTEKVMINHRAKLKAPIHLLIDNWHKAAAVADEVSYFGSMTDDAIFLGTDKTERWEKGVFEKWAQPHFEKDKAWAFTAHDRVVYFDDDHQLAWFEELLDTWMGTCRGSGVIELTDDGWKIKHYNLALLVDNDKMDKVIEVTK
ncbi:MAG: hypothetical protein ACI8XB_001236 [Patiriisocius sp.]|jgi:hypothetical protein